MRFKDKTYLITLLLFLLFLNAGIFSLAYYTQQENIKSAETLAQSEQSVIAKAFEDDITYLGNVGRLHVMASFGEYYVKKDIGLCFYSFADGEIKNITVEDTENGVVVKGTAVIPEPTTATLSLLALAGLAARRRRK